MPHLLAQLLIGAERAEERGRQAADEHGTSERGADRGAEVHRGVLEPTHLSAPRLIDGRDRHGAELGGHGADAKAEEQHRDRNDAGVRCRTDPEDQHEGPRQHQGEADADQQLGRARREEAWHQHGRQEEGERERDEPDAGCEGAHLEDHRQEEGDGEEDPCLRQVLEEEHGDAADHLSVREQLRIDKGRSIRRLESEFSKREEAEHHRTYEQHPDHR